jgi:uncharacterized SAM-binding protein YcdF (DUF218 family)
MKALTQSRRALLVVAVAVALGVMVLAGVFGLRVTGRYLLVADPVETSDAILVMDGPPPARDVEAAMLYRRGLAPLVVLSLPRDPLAEARRLAGQPSPQERAAGTLQHLGVPVAAIVRLDQVVDNSRQELAVHFAHARARGWRRVIIVTSPVHTRRVRLIWNAGYQAQVPALVHPTPHEAFEPDRWWRSARSLEAGLYELAAIANFLIGSPLPTYDRKE